MRMLVLAPKDADAMSNIVVSIGSPFPPSPTSGILAEPHAMRAAIEREIRKKIAT